MSDFFNKLVARHIQADIPVKPRVRSRFESLNTFSGDFAANIREDERARENNESWASTEALPIVQEPIAYQNDPAPLILSPIQFETRPGENTDDPVFPAQNTRPIKSDEDKDKKTTSGFLRASSRPVRESAQENREVVSSSLLNNQPLQSLGEKETPPKANDLFAISISSKTNLPNKEDVKKENEKKDHSSSRIKPRLTPENQYLKPTINIPPQKEPDTEKENFSKKYSLKTNRQEDLTNQKTGIFKPPSSLPMNSLYKNSQAAKPVLYHPILPATGLFNKKSLERERASASSVWKGQSNHAQPPTIKVNIGRVEVRALIEKTPPPDRKKATAKPNMSLDDYLKRQNERSK